ncbi:MAG: hypothetical protein O3C27_12190 [Actinomycetota bacterium]|nr:hypothetical protein [Actinomycetota bacterium]
MTDTRNDLIDNEPVPNESGNRPFHDVAALALSRRKVLGGDAAALVGFMADGPGRSSSVVASTGGAAPPSALAPAPRASASKRCR